MQNFIKTILNMVQNWTKKEIRKSTADWNQNDPGANNYVKNRTHWTNADGTVHKLDPKYIDLPDLPENIATTDDVQNALDAVNGKMDATDPVGSGSFSMGRKADTTVGNVSFALGYNTTASASYSYAEGHSTIASGIGAHAEGVFTTASGSASHSEGQKTIASGSFSHAEGNNTKATGRNQHAQGQWNIEDTSETYAHIVGNGSSDTARSNAHTLDWSGNAWYAGDVYVGSTSGTNKDEGSKKLATEEYVDAAVPTDDHINDLIDTALEGFDVPSGSDSSQNVDLSGVVKSVNGQTPDENGNVEITVSGGTASGWSTEEILLLESILKNCVTQSDQSNNIATLVTLLKSNSSGSEGSGGSGDSGGDDSGSSDTTYSVTLNLTNVLPSNMATSVASGGVYFNQLSVDEGYNLGTVTVTMGGFDVTKQYYDGNGNISITSVQGDIVITCKALAVETLTLVGLGTSMPNTTTFAYTENASFGQYNLAKESTIKGGTLRAEWDTNLWEGNPRFFIYLFKDGVPYKIGRGGTSATDESIESYGTLVNGYWCDTGVSLGATSMVFSVSPFTVKIPDGCTCMVCFNKGNLKSAGADAGFSNSEFSVWFKDGNITVTVTEGE